MHKAIRLGLAEKKNKFKLRSICSFILTTGKHFLLFVFIYILSINIYTCSKNERHASDLKKQICTEIEN